MCKEKLVQSTMGQLVLLICLFTASIVSADEYAIAKMKWEKCNFKELKSDTSKEINKKRGGDALHRHLIKKCGYRVVSKNRNGDPILHHGDCSVLFKFAEKNQCVEGNYTDYQRKFLLELDPKVFKKWNFHEACKEYQSSTQTKREKYISFKAKACL